MSGTGHNQGSWQNQVESGVWLRGAYAWILDLVSLVVKNGCEWSLQGLKEKPRVGGTWQELMGIQLLK